MNFLQTDQDLARDSFYAATVARSAAHPPLQGDLEADVVVVGGGLAGLSAAIELADLGYGVTLLEARQVGWGASGRNGGQAIAGLACEQSVIEEQLGLSEAKRVWAVTMEALDLIGQARTVLAHAGSLSGHNAVLICSSVTPCGCRAKNATSSA
jgi:gamma-glutamylputrescine oxidase